MSDSREPGLTFWKAAVLAFIVVVGSMGLTIGAVYWYGIQTAQSFCLADKMDRSWSRSGHTKGGEEREIALRQLEAIARIHIARSQKKDEPLCARSKLRQIWTAMQYFVFGSSKKSERWKIVSDVAWTSLGGFYRYPWPEEFRCVIDARPTALRPSPRILKPSLKYVGNIGTMWLYCE